MSSDLRSLVRLTASRLKCVEVGLKSRSGNLRSFGGVCRLGVSNGEG